MRRTFGRTIGGTVVGLLTTLSILFAVGAAFG